MANQVNDKEILNTIGVFSEQDVILFQNARKCISITKKKRLLSIGEVARSIYFLQKGSMVLYQSLNENPINYIDLHIPNEWIINHQSFINQSASSCHIEAYEDSELLELDVFQLHALIGQSQAFFQIGKLLSNVHERLEFYDMNHTPAKKLEYLLKHRPLLFQTFPLKMIASYLKITPETLSRLRAIY